jgi:hydrogenase maturation factor HypF (carbamoyltransferase family)
MLKKVDLRNQVSSLDAMIRVLSDELTHEPKKDSASDAHKKLLVEMEEALRELRQARGIRKVLLTALESRRAFH